MPILQRLAQPFNEYDDLTVYSDVFEPFLVRSLPWQIKFVEVMSLDLLISVTIGVIRQWILMMIITSPPIRTLLS